MPFYRVITKEPSSYYTVKYYVMVAARINVLLTEDQSKMN